MAEDTREPRCHDRTDCYVRWQEWNWERDFALDRALVAEDRLSGRFARLGVRLDQLLRRGQ